MYTSKCPLRARTSQGLEESSKRELLKTDRTPLDNMLWYDMI